MLVHVISAKVHITNFLGVINKRRSQKLTKKRSLRLYYRQTKVQLLLRVEQVNPKLQNNNYFCGHHMF